MKIIDEIRMENCAITPSVAKDLAYLMAIFIGAHVLSAMVAA